MNFQKSDRFDKNLIRSKIMGPNPLKLCEELLENALKKPCGVTLDLGSGTGITSVFLAKEYNLKVYAADLWSNPSENMRFFEKMGLSNKDITPLCVDANSLPFAHEFFDSIVSIDSYNYYGRNETYLSEHFLPYLKRSSFAYIAIPGMKKDCHKKLPACLLKSWTPEQLDYMHDINWWHKIISQCIDVQIIDMFEMSSTEEAWADWLECENEYSIGDRAAIEAGALEYLNTVAIILKRS